MRLVLDTHVLLWAVAAPDRLEVSVREQLLAETTDVLVSTVAVWEVAVKHALGKLALPLPLRPFVSTALTSLAATVLPVELEHALAVAELPPLHRDPFDRLLVAQAQVEGLTLVTADPQVQRYDVALLPVG